MNNDHRRITLVARGPASPPREWNLASDAHSRVIFADGFSLLQYALRNAMTEFDRDVERVILDRATTATQYLDLLATLPHEFTGDIMLVRHDDSGFLSATGRGGDRLLYSLKSDDLLFYLAAQGLVGAMPLRLIA
ncbi:MAG TPA: hypothetical protein VN181_15875 [Thermoanaerobaculia bacterium]|nr:hypothetical protein [Thermoanaerobaculia bacterium]